MLLHKPLPALAALVRFDPRMNSFMDVLLLVRGESLIAERAWVLKKMQNYSECSFKAIDVTYTHPLFAIVGPLMYVTNVLPCECLSANSAQKGLFRRVSVPLKKMKCNTGLVK